MKRLKQFFFFAVMAIAAMAVSSCSSSDSDNEMGHYQKVRTAEGFKTYIDSVLSNPGKYGDLQLIDYRSPEEFAEGHIPGAVNIPAIQNGKHLTAEQVAVEVSIFKQSGPIFVYGENDASASFYFPGAVSKAGWGAPKTFHMLPGYSAWVKEGYPIEK